MRLTHSYSAIQMYENCPLRYYRQRVLKDVVDKGGEASIFGDKIHKLLETRLKEDTSLPQEYAHYEPLCALVERLGGGGELHVEHELALTEDLERTGWWDSDVWIRGKLDVLVLRGDRAIVMDWKTGKRRDNPFQLELFAAQVFTLFPGVQEIDSMFVWLKTLECDGKHFTRADAPRLWADTLKRIQRIVDSARYNNWPAKPSGLCRFCPCMDSCEYGRR